MMLGAQMTTADIWMLVTIFVLLLALIFLALAEMSLSQMTKPRANALAESGSKSGKSLALLAENPTMWVNPLLLTVNVFQTVQATLTGIVAGRLFGPTGVAVGVALNVVVFFVLAEAVPKTYAVLFPVRGAVITGRPVAMLVRFWPLRAASSLLIKLTNVIVKGEGLKLGPFVAEQEFLGIVEAAAKDSVIEHEERELIKSVIEFGDTTVREIMVPRPDVVHVDDHLSVKEALDLAVQEGFSRLPVMRKDENDEDDVIGVITVKDLIVAERGGSGSDRVDSLVRSVDVVPEGKPVADVMRSMQTSKFHMVMVADEYGTIIGLVTLEDCLEELVGEIVDEHDDEEEPPFRKVGPAEYLFIGSLTISELNEQLGVKIPDEEYDTIGGYVFGVLGHVPEVGESVAIDGWVLSVEVLDGRRIQQLRARAAS